MTNKQVIYLRDILEYISRIETVAVAGRETFFTSKMHQDSIIRAFEVIGEIVKRLEPELTEQHPTVAWSEYAGFRDVLIHQYDKVLIEIVWKSVQNDLAPLRAAVEALLASITDNTHEDKP
ncbi:MAG: DUF86 domain-containing protein [Phototrophicaceae bacterium]